MLFSKNRAFLYSNAKFCRFCYRFSFFRYIFVDNKKALCYDNFIENLSCITANEIEDP